MKIGQSQKGEFANSDSVSTERTRKRYDRRAALYDRLYWPWEKIIVRGLREKLWADVPSGEILEIGPGTGINFSHHPEGAHVTAVDLSTKMLEQSRKRLTESGSTIVLEIGDVEKLDYPDASFDAAVATFVFCSVPDQIAGFNELRRVVKPGGSVHLLEHVRIDRLLIGTLMDLWDPVAVRIGGAHINRRTADSVREFGFIVEYEVRQGPGDLIRLIKAKVPNEDGYNKTPDQVCGWDLGATPGSL